MPYVYGDLFALLNFLVDLILLYATAKLAGLRAAPWRVVAAAAAGAFYAYGFLFPVLSAFYAPWIKVVVALALVAVAFAPLPPLELVWATSCFYGASLFVAGTMVGLSYLGVNNALAAAAPVAGVPWWVLLAAVSVFGLAAPGLWRRLGVRTAHLPHRVALEVVVGGRRIRLVGLVDTGNRLRDPLTGDPVVIAEARALADILPTSVLDALSDGNGGAVRALEALATTSVGGLRWRVLPYSAIGTAQGLLLGFRPDGLSIAGVGAVGPVVVALAHRLAAGGDYQALVHPALLQPGAGRRVS